MEDICRFYLSTKLLREAVEFSECRFRQDAIDTITVQIGGRESLSQEEEDKLRAARHRCVRSRI